MGQKFNYLVDPVKSVKTGRLQVAPGELKGLLTFLPFLKIKQYYKNSVSNREENLEAKSCPFKKPANLVSPAKRKTKKATHKYCSSSCSTIITEQVKVQTFERTAKKLKNY